MKRRWPIAPVPKTDVATWEITVLDSVGATFSLAVRYESPRNITPRVEPIHIKVVRAFFHSGRLKAGTPLEIASTPVTAAPPEANALRIKKMLAAPITLETSGGTGTGCKVPAN